MQDYFYLILMFIIKEKDCIFKYMINVNGD